MAIYNPEQQGPLDIGPGTPGYFGPGDGVSSPSPTAPPTSGGTTNGGFGGVMDFISKLFPGSGDGSGFGGINPNMIPFLTTALNQYNNSGKYMDLATKYADEMNPFGKQRAYYQDRLRQLTEDPNAYLAKSPDYQAALKQGIGALDSSMSAKGFSGSGHAADEAQSFGSMLASQYLDKDRQSLMQMAGSNIGPAAAAALISQGMKGSIDSQNQALSDLFAAFTKPKTNAGPGTGGGPGGSGPDLSNPAGISSAVTALQKAGLNPMDIAKILKSGGMGAVLSDGKVFYGFNQDGTPHIGTGDQGGWPGEPDGGYTPGGGYSPGEPGYETGGSAPPLFGDTPLPTDGGGGWVGSGDMDIPTIDWSNMGGGFDMGMFFD